MSSIKLGTQLDTLRAAYEPYQIAPANALIKHLEDVLATSIPLEKVKEILQKYYDNCDPKDMPAFVLELVCRDLGIDLK